jgi:hypothetical protein
MKPIDYAVIEPNISGVQVDGNTVRVSWKCPQTGKMMGESSATMAVDDSVGGRVQANIKRSIVSEIGSAVARFVSNLLGGAAGRVLSNAAYTASSDLQSKATANVGYTEATRRAAIVTAFNSVQAYFTWNESRERFESK